LNLTHSEAADAFAGRYGARRAVIEAMLKDFGPQDACAWAHGLGVETFVGSSGRVFPKDMKAAPLLRAWLARLRHPANAAGKGVHFHMHHRWTGWAQDQPKHQTLCFDTPQGPAKVQARAVVLALWGQLGAAGL
jgi:predicted flavoprotein YhiN